MTRSHARLLLTVLTGLLWLLVAPTAQAAVTITFWSHEFGNSFPHAFVTLRGTPDAGGAPVDTAYGFTAKAVTPAILFGDVGGTLDLPTTGYMADSDAQFSVVLTDAQYAQELALAQAWNGPSGTRYNLNKRNCVHFVKEAARIAGLAGLDQPKLMKKPRSYLLAVDAANPGAATTVAMKGAAYLAALPPLMAATPPPASTLPVPTPGVPRARHSDTGDAARAHPGPHPRPPRRAALRPRSARGQDFDDVQGRGEGGVRQRQPPAPRADPLDQPGDVAPGIAPVAH